ncbi:MAG: sulfite exporter TauE/SafE family protein [Nisaea sp.]|uniref:sulfite exporter TauE/SafE family protein n=1 Tax=Nisaea sp. TaxID=2024842 RepID=UPI001B24FFF7|nr:sulfite exporter TauE/SafE family protein [Nisaea sp.]MBO6560881.1 sulfite exporter TauE/SafE family protein [Nisaea sp.]
MQYDPALLAAVTGTFLLAGTVKGVIGLGLPTVTLGLMTLLLDLPSAMALLVAPSLATNIWQASAGGNARAILKRIWPFLATATVTIWIGAQALSRVDLSYLSALLGLLLVAYAVSGLAGFRLSLSPERARWSGPLFGTVNGILTGMTGSFMVPGVLYLQALGLTRDMLVQGMGMLFLLSTAALALSLGQSGLVSAELGMVSALGLVPAILGMVLGQKIRSRLSETLFQKVFFLGVLALGLYIVARAVLN